MSTFAKVPVRDVSGRELVTDAQRAKTLGLAERPARPAEGRLVHGRGSLPCRRRRPALPGSRAADLRRKPARVEGGHGGRDPRAPGSSTSTCTRTSFPTRRPSTRTSCCRSTPRGSARCCGVGFEITQAANGRVQLRPPAGDVARRVARRRLDRVRARRAARPRTPLLGRRPRRRVPGVARALGRRARYPARPSRGRRRGARSAVREARAGGLPDPVGPCRDLVGDVPRARSAPRCPPSSRPRSARARAPTSHRAIRWC